jgi:hypothetical protein
VYADAFSLHAIGFADVRYAVVTPRPGTGADWTIDVVVWP